VLVSPWAAAAAVATHGLVDNAHQPQHLPAAVGGEVHVEGEALLEVCLVDGQAHKMVGGFQDRGTLGSSGKTTVHRPAQAANKRAELHAMCNLVQQLVISLELGQGADESGVGVTHAPFIIAHCNLPRI